MLFFTWYGVLASIMWKKLIIMRFICDAFSPKCNIVYLTSKLNNWLITTGEGLIYKVVQRWDASPNTTSSTFLIDVWEVFAHRRSIEAMTLSKDYKSLYIASDYGMKQIKLSGVCSEHYDSCIRCSRDPYCGWDVQRDVCRPYSEGLVLFSFNLYFIFMYNAVCVDGIGCV